MSLTDDIEQKGYDANVAKVDRVDNPYEDTLEARWFIGWDRKENEPALSIPQNMVALVTVVLTMWQGMQS